VCSKSGVDSVSGNAGSRKFVNFMKMQQVGDNQLAPSSTESRFISAE
jgi:hypothetical protein